MVQILQENRRPTVGEQFGREFSNIGKQIPQMMEQSRQNAKEQQANQLYSKLLAGGELSEEEAGMLPRDDQFKAAQLQAQQLKGPSTQDLKFQQELMEKQQIKDTAQGAFDTLVKLTKGGNIGIGSKLTADYVPGATDTAKDVGEFQSTTGALEAMLVDMVSQGRLSDSRFKYITQDLLPKPNDRRAVIEGKLKGLAAILDLDPASLGGGSIKNKEGENIDWTKYYD